MSQLEMSQLVLNEDTHTRNLSVFIMMFFFHTGVTSAKATPTCSQTKATPTCSQAKETPTCSKATPTCSQAKATPTCSQANNQFSYPQIYIPSS